MKAEPKIKNLHGTAELEDQPHLTPSLPPPRGPPQASAGGFGIQKLCSCKYTEIIVGLNGTRHFGQAYAHRSPIKALGFTSGECEGRLAYSVVIGPCTNPDLGDRKK